MPACARRNNCGKSQAPNRGPGYMTVWLNASTPEYTDKHTDDSIPFKNGDRTANLLSAAGGLCRYEYDGKHNWSVKDTYVQINLVMTDHHSGIGYFTTSAGSLVSDAAKNHIEATGWVTGSVTVKDNTYQTAGAGWRAVGE